MKVLITGFDPFGGADINPAYEAVKMLPDRIQKAEIIKLEIPTVFEKDGEVLEKAISEHRPEVVICVGQAGGRSDISVEKNAYFATVPVKAMVGRIKENGIPSSVSYTAGTFVCNDIMYRLLYLAERQYEGIRGGFIHVPYLPEQAVNLPAGTPTMAAETIAKGLELAIEAVIENEEDHQVAMGTIM